MAARRARLRPVRRAPRREERARDAERPVMNRDRATPEAESRSGASSGQERARKLSANQLERCIAWNTRCRKRIEATFCPCKLPDRPRPPSTRRVPSSSNAKHGSWNKGRWMLLLLAVVCAAPVLASYFMYYVVKPTGGTTSYGALIEPQRPIPDAARRHRRRRQADAAHRAARQMADDPVNGSDCNEACVTRLYFMRQVRALQSAGARAGGRTSGCAPMTDPSPT